MNEDHEGFLAGLTAEQRKNVDVLLSMPPDAMARLTRIAEEDRHREWLFALIRKSAFWVGSTVAAFVLFWDQVKSLAASFLKGGQP